jgi:hypothetical protein
MNREFPTGLAEKCLQMVGQSLKARLVSGWGWHCYINGVQQPFESTDRVDSGDVDVKVQGFFRDEERLRGFTGTIRAPGHELDGLKAVFFTMSDGEDFDFRENICMAWGARFADREPLMAAEGIPNFESGTVYTGYAMVFEDEASLAACQERLNKMYPRKVTNG